MSFPILRERSPDAARQDRPRPEEPVRRSPSWRGGSEETGRPKRRQRRRGDEHVRIGYRHQKAGNTRPLPQGLLQLHAFAAAVHSYRLWPAGVALIHGRHASRQLLRQCPQFRHPTGDRGHS